MDSLHTCVEGTRMHTLSIELHPSNRLSAFHATLDFFRLVIVETLNYCTEQINFHYKTSIGTCPTCRIISASKLKYAYAALL